MRISWLLGARLTWLAIGLAVALSTARGEDAGDLPRADSQWGSEMPATSAGGEAPRFHSSAPDTLDVGVANGAQPLELPARRARRRPVRLAESVEQEATTAAAAGTATAEREAPPRTGEAGMAVDFEPAASTDVVSSDTAPTNTVAADAAATSSPEYTARDADQLADSTEAGSERVASDEPVDPAAIPLTRPGGSGSKSRGLSRLAGGNRQKLWKGMPTVTTVVSSLMMVVGLFLIMAWMVKRRGPSPTRALPREVLEILGRTPLPGRQYMHLVRIGRKLVLVASSSGDARPICEVTDPAEVERLLALCQSQHPQGTTQSFQRLLDEMQHEPPERGYLGQSAARGTRRTPLAAEVRHG